MQYAGEERRKYPRVNHPFLIYYYPLEKSELLDLSQAKNISMGGLLFTTARPFARGESVGLKMRFPGAVNPISSIGTVIDCHQVPHGAKFYDTRLQFSSITESDRQIMHRVLDKLAKK